MTRLDEDFEHRPAWLSERDGWIEEAVRLAGLFGSAPQPNGSGDWTTTARTSAERALRAHLATRGVAPVPPTNHGGVTP